MKRERMEKQEREAEKIKEEQLFIKHYRNQNELVSKIIMPDTNENWDAICREKIKWEKKHPDNVCGIGWILPDE